MSRVRDGTLPVLNCVCVCVCARARVCVKVKFALQRAMKAQRGSGGIALLFL
jgi:hypothetical protein